MAKRKRGLVFLSCVFSSIAVILSMVSLGTEQWVVSKGELTLAGYENDQLSTIKYGLFYGTIYLFHTRTHYQIILTCLMGENICAYLCKSTADGRTAELRSLFNGQQVAFDTSCPQVMRTNPLRSRLDSSRTAQLPKGSEREFLNAGLYVTTVFFLCVSIIFGVCCVILSFWNTVSNPIEAYLSIYGLYIYNAIAGVAVLLAILLWGIHFGTVMVDNVGILFTIQGQMDTRGLAELGYSYWLLLPSMLFHLTALSVLYIRQYLVSQEPQIKIHSVPGNKEVGDIMF